MHRNEVLEKNMQNKQTWVFLSLISVLTCYFLHLQECLASISTKPISSSLLDHTCTQLHSPSKIRQSKFVCFVHKWIFLPILFERNLQYFRAWMWSEYIVVFPISIVSWLWVFVYCIVSIHICSLFFMLPIRLFVTALTQNRYLLFYALWLPEQMLLFTVNIT